jgi:hypothetical protein
MAYHKYRIHDFRSRYIKVTAIRQVPSRSGNVLIFQASTHQRRIFIPELAKSQDIPRNVHKELAHDLSVREHLYKIQSFPVVLD